MRDWECDLSSILSRWRRWACHSLSAYIRVWHFETYPGEKEETRMAHNCQVRSYRICR